MLQLIPIHADSFQRLFSALTTERLELRRFAAYLLENAANGLASIDVVSAHLTSHLDLIRHQDESSYTNGVEDSQACSSGALDERSSQPFRYQ